MKSKPTTPLSPFLVYLALYLFSFYFPLAALDNICAYPGSSGNWQLQQVNIRWPAYLLTT